MAADFGNVTMGTGRVYVGGVDLGYLKGDVTYEYGYDLEDFEVDVPRELVGTIVTRAGARLVCPVAELSAANMSIAIGGLAITDITTGTDITQRNIVLTATNLGGSSLKKFRTKGAIVDNASLKVYPNGSPGTPRIKNTDYIPDFALGLIYFRPGGVLDPLPANERIDYDYVTTGAKRILLGAAYTLATTDVLFKHKRPQDGKYINVFMPKARVTGKISLKFQETNWNINEVEFKALSNREVDPTMPYGYIEREI